MYRQTSNKRIKKKKRKEKQQTLKIYIASSNRLMLLFWTHKIVLITIFSSKEIYKPQSVDKFNNFFSLFNMNFCTRFLMQWLRGGFNGEFMRSKIGYEIFIRKN